MSLEDATLRKIVPRTESISKGQSHVVWQADSASVSFDGSSDLVLCSPPYFHPTNFSCDHGESPAISDLALFAEWVAQILLKAASTLKAGQPLCFVKTDVKYKNTVLPVGFRIADACERLGLPIRAHWIWRRLPSYSPYSPSFANIFVMGYTDVSLIRHPGLFSTEDYRSKQFPTSFTPELFEQLIRQFTRRNATVLDPFLGLGSAVLAASRSGRWSVGIEKSPLQIAKPWAILRCIRALEFHFAD